MNSIEVADTLFMDKAIFDEGRPKNVNQSVDLRGAKIGAALEMDGSKFNVRLDMGALQTGRGLFMKRGAAFGKEVNLSRARIGSELSMTGSKFKGKLNMYNIQVGDDLFMNTEQLSERTEFDEIVLTGAKIGGQVTMSGSKFNGVMHMDSIMINGSLILRNEAEFSKALILGGAHISGQLDMSRSNFSGTVNMNGAEVVSGLLMHGAKFDASSSDQDEQLFDLRVAKVGSSVEISDSSFNVNLDFSGLQVGGALFIDRAQLLKSVNLYSAHIGSHLSLMGSKVKGKLDLNNVQVGGNLIMITDSQSERAEFEEIALFSAHISRHLSLVGSRVKGKLDLNGVRVDGGLFMNAEKQVARAEFAEVDMIGAQIGQQLSMIGSKFNKIVKMNRIVISGALLLREATFDEQVEASNAEIGSVDLSGGSFSSLNLSGTKIKGELRIGSDSQLPTKWAKGAKLILQDTEVKVLQDRKDSWPAELEITGFTYYRLGGLPSGESQPIATREVEWLKKWLEKQQLYSPQPHEQLAKVLKEEGYPSKARDVLYLSKDREKTATTGPNRYWLIFLKWTIGYGYKLHYIFYWLFGMTTFGTFLLVCFKQGPGKDIIQKEFRNLVKGVVDNYFYSLDMLMPILKLDEWSTVQLSGLTKYYFYIHKVIGYLLSFVIIAWLTGIVYR